MQTAKSSQGPQTALLFEAFVNKQVSPENIIYGTRGNAFLRIGVHTNTVTLQTKSDKRHFSIGQRSLNSVALT
jgi:hypothetical protein